MYSVTNPVAILDEQVARVLKIFAFAILPYIIVTFSYLSSTVLSSWGWHTKLTVGLTHKENVFLEKKNSHSFGLLLPSLFTGNVHSMVYRPSWCIGRRGAQPSAKLLLLHTLSSRTETCCPPTLYNSFQAFTTSSSSDSTKIKSESTKERCPICQTHWGGEEQEEKCSHTYGVKGAVCHSKCVDLLPYSFSTEKVGTKTLTEFLAVQAAHSMSKFAVSIFVLATPANNDDHSENQRVPVDVVAVLDVSGSMYGPKLSLLKSATNFLIDHMLPFDRLSLVTFSSTAQTILPLSNMTDKVRQDAKSAVQFIRADGTADITAGLNMGARVLEESYKLNDLNPVNSIIIFLSDGLDLDNSCQGNKSGYFKLLSPSIFPANGNELQSERFPVHTICIEEYGREEYDSIGMMKIGEASSGKSSEVNSVEMIPNSFAEVARYLGSGLLDVAAERVRVVVTSASPGVKIYDIYSWKTGYEIDSERKQVVIDVGDLYPGEMKEFLLQISIPKHSEDMGKTTPILDITYSYQDVVSKDTVQSDKEKLEVVRPATIVSPLHKARLFRYVTVLCD